MRYRAKTGKPIARIAQALLALILIMAPPSLGRLALGEPIAAYWMFPFETPRLAHAEFSWPIFWTYAGTTMLVLVPFLFRLATGAPSGYRARQKLAFPWWGWFGAALLFAAWALAWGGIPTAPFIRRHSFSGLWLGYIITVNALTKQRAGRCLLSDAPWRLLMLFPASTAFWWVFEYLNQFVGNWHYHQVSEAAPTTGAVLSSSLPFSTVLPAVVSTRDLLATFAGLSRGLDRWWRPPRPPRSWAVVALVAAVTVLGLLGVYPDGLYWAVWLTPLVVITALQALAGERSLLTPLAQGDWAVLWLAALAGLICGFFWELWNWHSLARWSYSIAYVERFHLFAMPLLGYGGYLPFGLTCIAAARLLTGLDVTPFAVKPHPCVSGKSPPAA
ncbi:hypothetical protein [Nitrococcus mobilis]|uniref:Uncharacterized protein n=1 Tax=Nitrococcus mobilis Nb-231 TaxID=314278 RepID=A4BLG8_9GAMM|nr:hypothetical protein [Nitrococcus mobilis]EAR23156.1 hypothetical protein NB231_15088 [Nitrococcus mobilis Nb-231]